MTTSLRFADLGLDPVAVAIGPLDVRWYSLAYIAGIMAGWFYLRKLLARAGSPMPPGLADDLVFGATLGVLVGGRMGYALFYAPAMLLNPLAVISVWTGGMSFHGGALGVLVAILVFARRHACDWLRVLDYVVCTVPIGLFFGRLANFVNGELWGRASNVAWAIVFPGSRDGLPRHPSQLYEAALEGLILFAILSIAFWRTSAPARRGMLTGVFLVGYGAARFIVEFFREPDAQLADFAARTGLHMGQWLTVPMIIGGVLLLGRAASTPARRQRIS